MSETERGKSTAGLAAGMADPPAAGADPSMEDILASIRRILAEEEAPAAAPVVVAPAERQVPVEQDDEVLQLDPSMLLPDPVPDLATEPTPSLPPPAMAEPEPEPVPEPSQGEPSMAPEAVLPPEPIASPLASLIGAEAAAAATSSVGSLLRTLSAERATQVYSGGPTIEDVVRAELRPLLKQWLDTYLPGLVERLVRAEIERVVGRAVP